MRKFLKTYIFKYLRYFSFDPLSRFPQGGKVLFVLLPPWGKVGMGVNTYKRQQDAIENR
jgi:hypothetical protein